MDHTSIPKLLNISDNLCPDEMYVYYSFETNQFISTPTTSEIDLGTGYQLRNPIPPEYLDKTKLKILIHLKSEFFHLFVDSLTDIFRLHNLRPDALFLIYVDGTKIRDKKYIDFISKVLDANNINYMYADILIDYEERRGRILVDKMSNFYSIPYLVKGVFTNQSCLAEVKYAISKVLDAVCPENGVDTKPAARVYLSRSKVGYYTLPEDSEYSGYKTDARIGGIGESALEGYFRSLGFTVVYPEDFSSFEDQIRFMNSVEVLASATGSGLINSAFMKDGGTVIEIRCEMLFGNKFPGDMPTYQLLISEYVDLSYIKGHTHIAIANNGPTKDVQDVLDKLNANPVLRLLSPAPTHTTLLCSEDQ